MKQVMALAVVSALLGVGAAQAQTSAATTSKAAKRKATPTNSAVAQQLSELKQALIRSNSK